MIVLDASAAVDLLLGSGPTAALADRILDPDEVVHAPHLLDLEVVQVLRRHWIAGDLSAERAEEALDDFRAMQIERHGHELFLGRIWALRHNLTAYDAAYIALAEALQAPLITRDIKLKRASGHAADVEVI